MRDEEIVATARAIRADPDLIVDTRVLDELLGRADAGEQIADEILSLLAGDPGLWEQFRRHMPRRVGEPRGDIQGGRYADLPGRGNPSAEIVYRCSVCRYEYPVYEVGEPVPDSCPEGHSPLIRRA